MPTFEELSQHTSYPVLHTQRNDGIIIVATRIPLTDVRLQQWGWILSQAYKVEQPSQNGSEDLTDSGGKRYSKIYNFADMQHYIEQWGCKEWEVGYFALGRTTNSRVTMRLEDKIVQEDTFKETIENLKKIQEKQANLLFNSINQQEKSSKEDFNNLFNGIVASLAEMHQEILGAHADQRKYIDNFIQSASNIFGKTQDDNATLISFQTHIEQLNETLKSVEHNIITKLQTTVFPEIGNQLTQIQATILEKIDHQPHLSEQNLSEHLTKLDQKQLERLETLTETVTDKCK